MTPVGPRDAADLRDVIDWLAETDVLADPAVEAKVRLLVPWCSVIWARRRSAEVPGTES